MLTVFLSIKSKQLTQQFLSLSVSKIRFMYKNLMMNAITNYFQIRKYTNFIIKQALWR